MIARSSTWLSPFFGDARPGFFEHVLREVDADDAVAGRVVRQGEARAHANLQDAPANALARRYHGLPSALENGTEDHVIHRCPARVDFFDRRSVNVDFRHF